MSVVTGTKTVLRQVTLRAGTREDVFWIDNALAHVGKRVIDDEGIIWTITETYGAKSFDDVDKQREAWKRWSDVLDGH